MAATQWETFFTDWPTSLPRGGVLQTMLNETIPYRQFWLKEGMLLLERVTPDALGARFVVVSFDVINLVKFTNPLSAAEITGAGFVEELPAQAQLA